MRHGHTVDRNAVEVEQLETPGYSALAPFDL